MFRVLTVPDFFRGLVYGCIRGLDVLY